MLGWWVFPKYMERHKIPWFQTVWNHGILWLSIYFGNTHHPNYTYMGYIYIIWRPEGKWTISRNTKTFETYRIWCLHHFRLQNHQRPCHLLQLKSVSKKNSTSAWNSIWQYELYTYIYIYIYVLYIYTLIISGLTIETLSNSRSIKMAQNPPMFTYHHPVRPVIIRC